VLWPTVPPIISQSVEISLAKPTSKKEPVIEEEVEDEEASDLTSYEVQDSSGVTITLTFEEPETEEVLTRLSGPSWPWPHQGCMMCLGNHMILTHGQSTKYLRSITYGQWQTLHDNLHNGKGEFVGVEGSGEGFIGYEAGGSSPRRGGLLRRMFGRW